MCVWTGDVRMQLLTSLGRLASERNGASVRLMCWHAVRPDPLSCADAESFSSGQCRLCSVQFLCVSVRLIELQYQSVFPAGPQFL